MKLLMITLAGLFSATAFAQSVAISNDGNAPHTSAMLDIRSNSKGILLPRTSTISRTGITNPAKGLILYDTTTNSFWFFNGSGWIETAMGNNGWNLTGNAGANPATNFLGTTDNQPLRIKLNSKWAGELNSVTQNFFIGDSAGFSTNSGTNNTAIGSRALRKNTSGYSNTAIGTAALLNNTSSNNMVAIGDSALYANTTGVANTAIGSKALISNTSGFNNVATGLRALYMNTTGYDNIAVGAYALLNNSTGFNNTAIGNYTLLNNTNGTGNTTIGFASMQFNSSGVGNTATGFQALHANTTGSHNVAIGNAALYANTIAAFNTALGAGALASTDASENTAIGFHALYMNNIGFNNTVVGSIAMENNLVGSNNVAIGNASLINNLIGDDHIAIGAQSGITPGTKFNTISIGNYNFLNGASNQAFIGNLSMTWTGGNTGWGTFSDERIKRNISDEVKGLDFITRLRAVTYYRDIRTMLRITGNKETPDYPGKYDIEKIKFSGFLAQEVEQAARASGYDFNGVIPPKVTNGLYTITYESFVVPLVKGMQEQQEMILALKQQVQLLEARIKTLENK